MYEQRYEMKCTVNLIRPYYWRESLLRVPPIIRKKKIGKLAGLWWADRLQKIATRIISAEYRTGCWPLRRGRM